MNKILMFCLLIALNLINNPSKGQPAENNQPKGCVDKGTNRTQWFTDARFGMFIHWGVYAVPARGEWVMHAERIPYKDYEQIARTFQPADFDATKIVSMAKNAGMKYLVITAKHHDGFCMWDTKLTDYNIVKWGGFKRDPMKELASECKKQGIKLGFYYSVRDWHHSDFVLHYENLNAPGPFYGGRYGLPASKWTCGKVYDCGCNACVGNVLIPKECDLRPTEEEGADMNRYLDYMKEQLKELLTNYGPIAVMWFDGQDIVDQKLGRVQELIDEMRRLQPDVLINDRIASHMIKTGMGDYGVFEQNIPSSSIIRPWESCITINHNWGFTRSDNHWKSTKVIVRNITDIVSKGGNLLLNIGPDGRGIVPEDCEIKLDSVGQWMKANGESIYGCKASSLPQPQWGRITTKGNKLYLHVFGWPADGKCVVQNLNKTVRDAYILSNKAKVPSKLLHSGLELSFPGKMTDISDNVIVIEYK